MSGGNNWNILYEKKSLFSVRKREKRQITITVPQMRLLLRGLNLWQVDIFKIIIKV